MFRKLKVKSCKSIKYYKNNQQKQANYLHSKTRDARFTSHVLCKRSVVLVTTLKTTKHTVSLAPTQSGIEYDLTARTTILQGILDDARLTYLLKKLNPLHATRTLKQREINLRLDNIKKIQSL